MYFFQREKKRYFSGVSNVNLSEANIKICLVYHPPKSKVFWCFKAVKKGDIGLNEGKFQVFLLLNLIMYCLLRKTT